MIEELKRADGLVGCTPFSDIDISKDKYGGLENWHIPLVELVEFKQNTHMYCTVVA